ncbi:MAG: hypothetical protein PHT96_13490 [Syntrophorhabdaceae bacterium]|nr:hypothetical protein [Syntrophorhabdaceae bacterium]MDD4197397.1 hypothetical protein [Syntrophorhabdaceae bacterium]
MFGFGWFESVVVFGLFGILDLIIAIPVLIIILVLVLVKKKHRNGNECPEKNGSAGQL